MQSSLPRQRTYVSCFDFVFHFVLLRNELNVSLSVFDECQIFYI
jgi:hypothetical protein